jgi:carbonic anhydrase
MSDDRRFSLSTAAARGISRRRFFGLAAASSVGVALAPLGIWAQDRPPACQGHGPYDAMVLSCIDPRIIDPVHYYMEVVNKQRCRYSQFVIAGAAVGVVAPKFTDWHVAFWENLDASISLHKIKKVIAIDHRDCGATKIAYGEKSIADPATETATHKRVLAAFQKEVNRLHPDLEVVTGLMALDGNMELFTGSVADGRTIWVPSAV